MHIDRIELGLTADETKLVDILRGPKQSDAKIGALMGRPSSVMIDIYRSLRTKLGADNSNESLRDFVRKTTP
jgi:hypothetical protein